MARVVRAERRVVARRRADEGGDEEGSRRRDRKKREDKPDTDEEALDPETRMFNSYWQLVFVSQNMY